MDPKGYRDKLCIDAELCSTCCMLISDVLSGDFCVKWEVRQRKPLWFFLFKHRNRDYFNMLKRPCCHLCEMMAHAMWNRHTPCALQAKESWDLWINIETREGKADILLDDLKLCCRPGLKEDNSFNSQQYFLESFVLDILLEDSGAISPSDQYILPDLPIGLPFDEIKDGSTFVWTVLKDMRAVIDRSRRFQQELLM